MRGLDTNVLLRTLTADDPAQAQEGDALFAAAERTGERFFISVIVLCELSWTLRGPSYRFDRGQVASALEQILDTSLFEVQHRGLVRRAIADFGRGRADFADYLIGRECLGAGCADTVTFDRKLKGAAGFSLLA